MAATHDGFALSRVDLEQRREGDVLGADQSGRRSSLRMLRLLDHEDVIVEARGEAVDLVEADLLLAGQPALRAGGPRRARRRAGRLPREGVSLEKA